MTVVITMYSGFQLFPPGEINEKANSGEKKFDFFLPLLISFNNRFKLCFRAQLCLDITLSLKEKICYRDLAQH